MQTFTFKNGEQEKRQKQENRSFLCIIAQDFRDVNAGGIGGRDRSHNAFLGQLLTHSMHSMHSVPYFLVLELSVTSTSIGHTRLHLPQLMHLSFLHLTRSREK